MVVVWFGFGDSKQNFKFRPSRFAVPDGSFTSVVKLWKAMFCGEEKMKDGCSDRR